MAVEAVAYIRSVRNALNDSIHLTELLYLQTTKTLCRCSVDCIQITIFLLKLIYFIIDIFQNFQGKLPVSRQLTCHYKAPAAHSSCNTERSCHRLQDLADLFVRFQMSAIETALTVCQRVRGCTHLSQIFISTDMQITDHLR